MKRLKSFDRVRILTLQDRTLLAIAGQDFVSLRYFSKNLLNLCSLVYRINNTLKIRKIPIKLDEIIKWINIIREPITDREKARFAQLLHMKGIGNKVAKLMLFAGINPKNLGLYKNKLEILSNHLNMFNKQYKIVTRSPNTGNLWAIITALGQEKGVNDRCSPRKPKERTPKCIESIPEREIIPPPFIEEDFKFFTQYGLVTFLNNQVKVYVINEEEVEALTAGDAVDTLIDYLQNFMIEIIKIAIRLATVSREWYISREIMKEAIRQYKYKEI